MSPKGCDVSITIGFVIQESIPPIVPIMISNNFTTNDILKEENNGRADNGTTQVKDQQVRPKDHILM